MTQYLGNLTYNVATIGSGTTTSDAIDLQGLLVVQLIMPAALTGTAISFQSSHDNVTFQDCYNDANSLITITVAVNRTYNIDPKDFAGCRYFKIVSNASEAADRAIGIVAREDTLCHF